MRIPARPLDVAERTADRGAMTPQRIQALRDPGFETGNRAARSPTNLHLQQWDRGLTDLRAYAAEHRTPTSPATTRSPTASL